LHVTISTNDSTAEEADKRIVYMEDLEKRKQAYGICRECNKTWHRRKLVSIL
jgi:hypothetical protein